jgi:two-component system response regulator (stage 0 sporulation protein F)
MKLNKSKTILYVDDEEINQFIFLRYFETQFTILTASSGVEALKLLQDQHGQIDAVISDMRMPGMDGIEFIKKARQDFSGMPYYLLTAFSNSTEIEKALENKLVDKIFNKPYDVSVVGEELEKIN